MNTYYKYSISKMLNRSFFRFTLTTTLNFIISYFPYLFLIYVGVGYLIAYFISFILLLISSTLFHIKLSFLSIFTIKKIVIYSIYYTLYFCMGCLVIWYSIEFISIDPYYASLLNVILLPAHYFLSKKII